MTPLQELPAWAALPVALLLLAGAGLARTGSLGLLRLGTFYARVHAPTLGIGSILAAWTLFFSVLQGRLVLQGLLIAALMAATTPVTLMLLARAALYRDRPEGSREVPRAPAQDGGGGV